MGSSLLHLWSFFLPATLAPSKITHNSKWSKMKSLLYMVFLISKTKEKGESVIVYLNKLSTTTDHSMLHIQEKIPELKYYQL